MSLTTAKQSEEAPFPVDISKIEASDSVQSHLSTTTSSKRLRMHPTSTAEEPTKNSSPDIHLPVVPGPESYAWLQRISIYAQKSLLADSPYIPTFVHSTRQERPWTSSITTCALVFYCLLSCLIASGHLYMNIFNPVPLARPLRTGSVLGGSGGVSRYLTKSLVATSTTFEPFVLSSTHIRSNVTICAWLPDSKLYLLDEWIQSWQGSVSLLITTHSTIDSASHRNLLASMRRLHSKPMASGIAIHILYLKGNDTGSPNLYLNLARLFAATEWTLIFPGELNNPIPSGLDQILSSKKSKADIGDYVLAPGTTSYPFPNLSPLLLRRDRDFWCTERIFAAVSRVSDWNECLWQLNLETTGGVNTLDVMIGPSTIATEDRISVSERVVQQRLTARYRADVCDSFIKQISMVRSRGRHRDRGLNWVKGFCSKSADRKRGL